MTAQQISLVHELQSDVCRCHEPKNKMQTFCRSCYYTLSPALRMRLYRRIGEGYEEAYGLAVQTLQHKGRIKAA